MRKARLFEDGSGTPDMTDPILARVTGTAVFWTRLAVTRSPINIVGNQTHLGERLKTFFRDLGENQRSGA